MAVYSEQQINRLVAYKPNAAELRTHLIMLFLFDVGARISEVLSLCADSLDFDNMLVRLDGKGSKTRIVPFSTELRKRLVRYIADAPGNRLVFATRNGTKLEPEEVSFAASSGSAARWALNRPPGRCTRPGIASPPTTFAGAGTQSPCNGHWATPTLRPRSDIAT